MDRSRVTAHPLLTGLVDEELDAVSRVASERKFAAGETLMSEGDFGHCLFLIEAGSARVSVNGTQVALVGPGDVVGEAAVLVSGRRTASVVAATELRAISFFKRNVWGLEREAPEAARRLRAAFDERVAPTTSGPTTAA